MTDIDPLIARQSALHADRQPAPRRRRRRHPAGGARIVAAGLGASTMFGLVAAMGIASAVANSSQASSSPVSATPAAVVPNMPTTAAPGTIVPSPVAPSPVAPSAVQAPAGPIVLQTRPQVSVVNPTAATPAPAPTPQPAAVTSGSA